MKTVPLSVCRSLLELQNLHGNDEAILIAGLHLEGCSEFLCTDNAEKSPVDVLDLWNTTEHPGLHDSEISNQCLS